jgi:polysaccharide export outer membrane protein
MNHLGRGNIALMCSAVALLAISSQSQTAFERESSRESNHSTSQQVRSHIADITQIPLESSVDPTQYYVGPSDVLFVAVGPPPAPTFTLTVTPEGTLIIPTVGEVRVVDLQLQEAKSRIIEKIRAFYKAPEAFVTLLRPRPIVVMVTGNVLNPGLYTLSSIDRAHRAIEEANKIGRLQTRFDLERVQEEMSTRNILLKHKGGTSSRVDIQKFLSTKLDHLNPYLREGNVVVVPRRDPVKHVFGIYGEVNLPGRYEFVLGDSVLDALEIAQGLTSVAIGDSVLLSTLSQDGSTLTTVYVDLQAIVDRRKPNIALHPGDRIVVRAIPSFREDFRVSIQGEVLYPGIYPITRSSTRLSEIVERAGGFTSYASLRSAEVIRRSVSRRALGIEQLLSHRGGVSPGDSAYYQLETQLRIDKEVVNVDFERLFVHGDSTQDIVLVTNDDIVIPHIQTTIYVFGQVVSPGHIDFVPRQNYQYYIAKSGGYTDRARRADIKIIKARTRQWLDPEMTNLESGDHIWVPREPDRDFAYYMSVLSQAATVLSVVIGIAAIVIQVSK